MLRLQISFGSDPKPPKPHEIISMIGAVMGAFTSFASTKKNTLFPAMGRFVGPFVTPAPQEPNCCGEDVTPCRSDVAPYWTPLYEGQWVRLSNGDKHPKGVILASIQPTTGGLWLWRSDFLLDNDALPVSLDTAIQIVDRALFAKDLIAKKQVNDWRMFVSKEPKPVYEE